MRKITRSEINQENMVALGYCQAQAALNHFGYDYKVGYNSGVYGWNYDLYKINGVDIVTGYRPPYCEYSKKDIKNKLIAFENKLRELSLSERYEKEEILKKEFFEIFK